VNTGFGSLAEVLIPHESLGKLQVNLLRSHAAGVGPPLSERAVRATIVLRANVLAKGYSGIREETLAVLVELLNRRVHPVVPSRGSVGASGDLAPLAHLALVLIGEGEAFVPNRAGPPPRPKAAAARSRRSSRDIPSRAEAGGARGEETTRVSGAAALGQAGLSPVSLAPKEGLALINGTQPSTAVLALAVTDGERLAAAADIAAALSIDALRGSAHPFEDRIHEVRPLPGQRLSAANIAMLLRGSAINKSHAACGTVQDAYSLRCAAQVHGAAREALRFVREIVEIEANAATDNPMVFVDTGEIVSGGNFHGAPVALAADTLAIGLAHLATISERRIERLVNPASSGLPAFLTTDSGVQSGFMMAHVTAAAATSELKTLCAPASVDSIPTSAGREDHVSMSMAAALKSARAVELLSLVLAIEILCACQAIDLLAPLTTSDLLARIVAKVREHVPPLDADRSLSSDIEQIAALIASDVLRATCAPEVK
jgi:histidine ammonia-lyase